MCIFYCWNNSATRCNIATDPNVKKQIIINDKQYFVCLGLEYTMLKHAKRTINVLNVTVNTITRCVPSVPKLSLIEVEKSIFLKRVSF